MSILTEPGDLAETPLAAILLEALNTRSSGVLEVAHGGGTSRLWFRDGRPVGAQVFVGFKPLGMMLLQAGLIDIDALSRSLALMAQTRRPQGELLVEMGAASAADVARVLAEQQASYFGIIAALDAGRYVFDASTPVPEWTRSARLSPVRTIVEALERPQANALVGSALQPVAAVGARLSGGYPEVAEGFRWTDAERDLVGRLARGTSLEAFFAPSPVPPERARAILAALLLLGVARLGGAPPDEEATTGVGLSLDELTASLPIDGRPLPSPAPPPPQPRSAPSPAPLRGAMEFRGQAGRWSSGDKRGEGVPGMKPAPRPAAGGAPTATPAATAVPASTPASSSTGARAPVRRSDPAEARARRQRLLQQAMRNMGVGPFGGAPSDGAHQAPTSVVPTPAGSALAPAPGPAAGSAEAQLRDALLAIAPRAREKDLFVRLGVPETAVRDDVKKAFLALAKQFHPDRFASPALAEQQTLVRDFFAAVNEAYEVLSDDRKRAAYLEKRKGGDRARSEAAQLDFQKGEACVRTRDFARARGFLESAVRAEPRPAYQAALAWAYVCDPANRDRERPRALVAEATRDPSCDRAFYVAGILARDEGNDVAAEKAFRAAIQANPRNADAVRELRIVESRRKKR